MRICIVFLAFALISINALAQTPDTVQVKSKKDSIVRSRDSIKSKPFIPSARVTKSGFPDSTHSPHKAFLRSLMVPGWGQLYNHRWWKVPLVYGGLGTLGGIAIWNYNNYKVYVKEARIRQNGGVSTGPYKNVSGSYQVFYDAANASQRNFQLCILGFAGFWGINCIDAYIDAKFIHSYSIDNNLSFRLSPAMIQQPNMYAYNSAGNYIPSLKLTLAFK